MSIGGSGGQYIHGTSPEEQDRLSLLNELLNASSLRAMRLRPGDRVLDLGSGLGQLTRAMAHQVQPDGLVVGVERDENQLASAQHLSRVARRAGLVEFRLGEVAALPLTEEEWGGFDVAHARFLLEHLPEPEQAVEVMLRAVRPGGRIIVEDDNHDLLRLWPPLPAIERLWDAYIRAWLQLGNDPFVGRRLMTLLEQAGAEPRRSDMLFFGGCAGESTFEAYVDNFVGILDGARQAMREASNLGDEDIDAALVAFEAWSRQPDATLWYVTCWAEGVRPGGAGDGQREAAVVERSQRSSAAEGEIKVDSYRAMLEFLSESAEDLSSTLRLEEVFQRIAQRVQLLLDAHLFCVLLWNEDDQILEHSYSLKFGEHIEQEGGFPLGYGFSGSAAKDMRPIRVANVLADPRYVRFRHAEVEIRSELAVPLISQGRLVGVLDLESVEFDAFTAEHERALVALASHMAAALENARLYERVRREEQRLERDLAAARKIQKALLPRRSPEGKSLEVGFAHHAARELSGDFFDFLEYSDGRLVVAVGDVAGKGTPAALLASLAVGILRSQILQSRGRPGEILGQMNQHLRGLNIEHRFVALLLAIYEPDSRRVRLSDSGVPQPLRLHQGRLETIEVSGLPLGRIKDVEYQEDIVGLTPGDVLVLLSDGVEDCLGSDGEPFGREGIERVLLDTQEGTAQQIADAILAAAEDHCLGRDREVDDRTLVVMKAI